MISVAIFDDNKPITDRIANTVPWEKMGCQVVAVEYDGYNAKKAIAKCLPQLIISDIKMPNLSGLEVIELSRSLIPDSQIIFISAYDQFEYAYGAIKLNALDYLRKPFTQAELFRTIERAVKAIEGHHEKEKELSNHHCQNQPVVKGVAERTAAYVEAHLNEHLTLEKLADVMGLNATHLGRIIKQESGLRFTQMLTKMRMDKAKKLLESSDYRVGEIGEFVGYKNYLTFYKVFCKVEGIPPTEYSRKRRAGGLLANEDQKQADAGNDRNGVNPDPV